MDLAWGTSAALEIGMDLLAPKIADIPPDGLSLSGDVSAEQLALGPADAVVKAPLAVGLDLRAVEDTVCVTGVVEGTAVRQCVRCLKEFEDPIAFSVRVAYEREIKSPATGPRADERRTRKPAAAAEAEPEDRDDDVYPYTGDHLDLAPMLREQLILTAPMHPLCREDCLGLCPRCGHDLNDGPCPCPPEPSSGPFDILKTLKPKTD